MRPNGAWPPREPPTAPPSAASAVGVEGPHHGEAESLGGRTAVPAGVGKVGAAAWAGLLAGLVIGLLVGLAVALLAARLGGLGPFGGGVLAWLLGR